MSSASEKQYHIWLIAGADPHWDNHSLDSGSWKTPVDIDDADLTFDGKPLNLLHEENKSRWMVEHHIYEQKVEHHIYEQKVEREEDDGRGRAKVEERRECHVQVARTSRM